MSRQENDRKIRPNGGKRFPAGRPERQPPARGDGFAAAIAAALHEEFGRSGSAVKTIALITGANERAVRNWYEGKNGPTGIYLMDLMQHSDRVLEAVLLLSGRDQVAKNVMLSTLCVDLRELISRIEVTGLPKPS